MIIASHSGDYHALHRASLLINYTNIANDAQVTRATVQQYFQILRDTLIGVDLPAWKRTARRKPITTSKFFFDVGVACHLQQRRHVAPGTPEFGKTFEAFFHHELRGLEALLQEANLARAIVASLEPVPRRVGRIEILPWQLVLERLWAGELTR